ncbi:MULTISPECIES: PH domain-containing protein [Virgibacillus]|uniref:PH domain-containing protein n=1 Tax=Virgibacillus TaxID=84406 RepID=UPI0003887849|nr:PH domain-containing protein [Virgibacillus salexigens]EQB38556.1 hypothetical protein M948_08195 [Virgibacillus sp. CM-4]BCT36570.1 PH domain-containing protein [Virgibacillus salexigens]BCT36579.1 PH domain-containing protein [Virgibacillus salexigens]
MYKIKEPTQRISPDAIKVWRITDALTSFIFLVVVAFFLYLHHYYDWPHWIEIALYAVAAIVCLSAMIELIVIPVYKQKTWRYEIDSNCIQLKHGGAIRKTHMIIPMNKVYFVDTYQGPILKKYHLSTIKIGTVGYVHEIPSVPENTASEIRNDIAYLSGINKRKTSKEEGNEK